MYSLAEQGIFPDFAIRCGIRALLKTRLSSESVVDIDDFMRRCSSGRIAVLTEAANQQHYEVQSEFFEQMLGPRMKYSSLYFEEPNQSFELAEVDALKRTVENARLEDGQRILELGCGWGSLSCYMAEHFPNAQILAVSNSASQKEFIDSKHLPNLKVLTADIAELSIDTQFDRIVSVEAFEHMRNYRELFTRIENWLTQDGLLFFHVFNHKDKPYLFESGWMAQNFFSGGTMLSEPIIPQLASNLSLVEKWRWNGTHYGRTLRGWLERLDSNVKEIQLSKRDIQKWRIFLMACEELFNFRDGDEWYVTHWLFKKKCG